MKVTCRKMEEGTLVLIHILHHNAEGAFSLTSIPSGGYGRLLTQNGRDYNLKLVLLS